MRYKKEKKVRMKVIIGWVYMVIVKDFSLIWVGSRDFLVDERILMIDFCFIWL